MQSPWCKNEESQQRSRGGGGPNGKGHCWADHHVEPNTKRLLSPSGPSLRGSMNYIWRQFIQGVREKCLCPLALLSPIVSCSPLKWTGLKLWVVCAWAPNGPHGICAQIQQRYPRGEPPSAYLLGCPHVGSDELTPRPSRGRTHGWGFQRQVSLSRSDI